MARVAVSRSDRHHGGGYTDGQHRKLRPPVLGSTAGRGSYRRRATWRGMHDWSTRETGDELPEMRRDNGPPASRRDGAEFWVVRDSRYVGGRSSLQPLASVNRQRRPVLLAAVTKSSERPIVTAAAGGSATAEFQRRRERDRERLRRARPALLALGSLWRRSGSCSQHSGRTPPGPGRAVFRIFYFFIVMAAVVMTPVAMFACLQARSPGELERSVRNGPASCSCRSRLLVSASFTIAQSHGRGQHRPHRGGTARRVHRRDQELRTQAQPATEGTVRRPGQAQRRGCGGGRCPACGDPAGVCPSCRPRLVQGRRRWGSFRHAQRTDQGAPEGARQVAPEDVARIVGQIDLALKPAIQPSDRPR